MALVYLSQGRVAIVDDADLGLVSQYKWFVHSHGRLHSPKLEALTYIGNGKQLRMHRLIMNPPDGMVVDHLNGDQLDNRRGNLRICTQHENTMNRHDRRTSQFPGVSWSKHKRRWRAGTEVGGKFRHLGYYRDETEAAAAYMRFTREV